MVQFFEAHLGTITLLLTLGTFWMAVSTRATAQASAKIFELESRPYLIFSKPLFRHFIRLSKDDPQKVESKTLRLGLEFRNSGRVPIRYSITNIRMTFDSRTVDNPTFITKGAIIYPGDFGIFWFGDLPYNEKLEAPKGGVIEYEVIYEAIDQKRSYRKAEKMEYLVLSFETFNVDWRYLVDSEEAAL